MTGMADRPAVPFISARMRPITAGIPRKTRMPKVSVVIPCFNHGAFLEEASGSLWCQTFRDFEVVIVDDGSTDFATIELLNRLANSGRAGLVVIRTSNRGVSAARNRAIAQASGSYILPLDADDRIGSDYLALAAAVLDGRPAVAVVYCERQMFGERQGASPLPDYDPRRLLVENLIHQAAMFRKSAWNAVGGFNERMIHGWEDWDFWIAVSRLRGEVVKLPEALFFYRVRSVSRDHSLRVFRKMQMYGCLVWRNRSLYLRHLPYVVGQLVRIHLLRQPE